MPSRFIDPVRGLSFDQEIKQGVADIGWNVRIEDHARQRPLGRRVGVELREKGGG